MRTLSPAEFRILERLERRPDLHYGEPCSLELCLGGGELELMTIFERGLEARGLVEAYDCAVDESASHPRLTPRGRLALSLFRLLETHA